MTHIEWQQITSPAVRRYVCHYCDHTVAADKGWYAATNVSNVRAWVFACPNCQRPTFFETDHTQIPSPRIGRSVKGVTDPNVERLYNEARDCSMVGAHTAAALLCRKLLMNIAVQHGAKVGLPFAAYVDYLAANGFVPPNGKGWVDQIRKKGNEATHEIPSINQADAQQLLTFVEMLLRFIYEFPSMLTPAQP
ncbi:MAG: DUF4145 domain-containing protein [Pseudomonadota bacterium]